METKVEIGINWVDVVRRNYKTDDMIVCFAEQRAGFLQKPLSQILASNLTIPIYVVSGVRIPQPRPNWLVQVTAWLGSIVIIACFGLLQVRIMQVSEGWFQTLLLILVVVFEIWLIWLWDSWFREALRVLEEDGLFARRHRVCTFVIDHPILKNLSFNFDMTEMMMRRMKSQGNRFRL